jgi:hypothetical protein
MKFSRIFFLAVIILFPQLTPAGPPIAPKQLGHLDAAVAYCVKVDSASADKYKEHGKKTVAGMTEKQLAAVRATSDYQETYDAITAELGKIPADKAVESCRAVLKEDHKAN